MILPSIFNLAGMTGFCILNSVLGGQTLSSVSGGGLSWRYVTLSLKNKRTSD